MWCVLVFVGLNVQNHSEAVAARWGNPSPEAIFNGAYWALVTSALVHVEPIHLIFNLYWLWFLGGAFERAFGPARWVLFVVFAAFISSGLEMLSGSFGIVLSGVGYALFGFGWMARNRFPEFGFVNQKVVQLFIGWGILCVITTYLGIMHVANVAHAGGLLFGVAVGAFAVQPKLRIPMAASLAVLLACSIVPLFWDPLSVYWVSEQAFRATKAGNYDRAIALTKRSIQMGQSQAWAWYNLTLIYDKLGKEKEFQDALSHLKRVDPDSAKEFEPDDQSDGASKRP